MVSIALQVLVNGLTSGAIYALVAIGLSLMYNVIKFSNFAHGATVVTAAYFTFLFSDILGLNFFLSSGIGILVGIALAIFINHFIYREQRKRKTNLGVMLVTSIAVLLFVTNLIFLLFGSSPRVFDISNSKVVYDTGLFIMTSIQVIIIVVAIVLLILFWFLIKKTRLGKAMRATSDNKDVAQTVGINSEKIYLYTFIISAITAGIGGILIGLDSNVVPMMGVNLILFGFASAVIGGYNSVPGAVAGGFFIGIVENIVVWFLPSGYRAVIIFTLLFLFLIFRPQGLLGKVYEK